MKAENNFTSKRFQYTKLFAVFSFPEVSKNKPFKMSLSRPRRLNCFRYFRYALGKFGDSSGLHRFVHQKGTFEKFHRFVVLEPTQEVATIR